VVEQELLDGVYGPRQEGQHFCFSPSHGRCWALLDVCVWALAKLKDQAGGGPFSDSDF
jgi:hypothetical protein